MEAYYLYLRDQPCHIRGVKGGRAQKEEGPRSCRDPQESGKTKSCIRVRSLFVLAFPFPPRDRIQWGSRGRPKVAEPIRYRVLFPAIEATELPALDPPVPDLLGQEDQSELRATPGTRQSIGKEKMHPGCQTYSWVSNSGITGPGPYWAHCPGLSDTRA